MNELLIEAAPILAPIPEPVSESVPAAAPAGLSIVERIAIDGTAPVFAGHFPSYPILPGVLLIAFARASAGRALGRPVHLRRVVRQRFMRPVLPDTVVTLECDISPPRADGYRVQCRWKLPDGIVCSRAELLVV